MAFQGNLSEFSVTDVLQLLGNQSKTGCLVIEAAEQRAAIYLVDGRVVSTRNPGLAGDDPLLRFLIQSHRLSDEQHRGIITIQRESRRDLEDLLLNGRYMDSDELGRFIERQIFDEVTQLMSLKKGSYRFDPQVRWPFTPIVRIPTEAAILEVVRRLDEQRRHAHLAKDPGQILALRDLPDPDMLLSEEECEVFGIIDGLKTIGEVVEASPLSSYEAYETLFNMLENGWIEIIGRREGTKPAAGPGEAKRSSRDARRPRISIVAELGAGLMVIAAVAVLHLAALPLRPPPTHLERDVFAEARVHEVELALDLYHRNYGRYPDRLQDLVDDRWITADGITLQDGALAYRVADGNSRYHLSIEPD